jgi:hypothetical protein
MRKILNSHLEEELNKIQSIKPTELFVSLLFGGGQL